MSYRTKLFMMLGKLQRAHPTSRGHFAPAYLVGSNKLRAYLFFIYALTPLFFRPNFWVKVFYRVIFETEGQIRLKGQIRKIANCKK